MRHDKIIKDSEKDALKVVEKINFVVENGSNVKLLIIFVMGYVIAVLVLFVFWIHAYNSN